MSKFASVLPDIDTAPDVYETPDVAVDGALTLRDRDSDTDTEALFDAIAKTSRRGKKKLAEGELVSNNLSIRDARALFKDKDAHSRVVPVETLAEKLHRLKSEIVDLEAEVEANTAGISSVDTVLNETHMLRASLEEIERRLGQKHYGDRLGRGGAGPSVEGALSAGADGTTSTSAGGDGTARASTASTIDTHSQANLSTVESRLAGLERLLGANEADVLSDSGAGLPASTLVASLERVERLLSMLSQPRHIDTLSKRLKVLLADLDRASKATGTKAVYNPTAPSEQASDSENSQQLKTMLEALNRIDTLIPLAPRILSRLRTLSALHEQAAQVVNTVQQTSNDVTALKQQQDLTDATLKTVEASMAENKAVYEKNMAALESRLNALKR